MIAELLKQHFDPIIKLDLEVWDNFSKLGEEITVEKETIIKNSGKTEKYYTFLIEGSGGLLIWNNNNYVCTDLCFHGQHLMDYVSFMLQKPTAMEVKVFEDSRLYRIPHMAFQKVFEKGNYGIAVTLNALEAAYFEKQEQQIALLTQDAKERYLNLVQSNPRISTIPLKYLASYLGITPQSLSRIRSEKVN